MKYLILTPSSRPIEEFDDITEAREYIAGTDLSIMYILENKNEHIYDSNVGTDLEQTQH